MRLYEVVKVYEVEATDEDEAKRKIGEMEVLGKQWLLLRGTIARPSSWTMVGEAQEHEIFRRV
jgi:hypothetical protein